MKSANFGRPKKFGKAMNNKVMLLLTDGQLLAIKNKMEETGLTVRLDYFRKVLRKDIENFDNL